MHRITTMNSFNLLHIFYLFVLNLNVGQPSMTISHTQNRFEIYLSGRVRQKVYSPEWHDNPATYEANLENLQLLRNTRILAPNQRSCVVGGKENKSIYKTHASAFHDNVTVSTEGIKFAEVAKVTKNVIVSKGCFPFIRFLHVRVST